MAAYLALLEPGDTVLGMRLDQGGHLTHGSPVNFSGRLYNFVAYGVDDEHETLDYDALRGRRQRAPPEDDRGRRHGVPADHRLRRVPGDRRRRRRAPARRRRAHRRAHRRRRAPVADPPRRRRDVHDPQDAARPSRRCDPVPRGVRRRDRQGGVPRAPGRAAHARRSRPRPSRSGWRSSRSSASTRPRSSATRRHSPTRSRRRASASCRVAPTTTSCSSTSSRSA